TIFREADGKISGTYWGSKITELLVDNNQITGFVFDDGTASVVNKHTIEKTKQKYSSLWTEFVSSFDKKVKIDQNKTQDSVYEKPEIEAMFPGGEGAWQIYVDRKLNKNIGTENKAPGGNYTVWIQFIVNKDGSVRDIKSLTNHGYGMEKEAIKMIQKGPKWVPAMQNGKKVSAYRKQRFDFSVSANTSFRNMFDNYEKTFPTIVKDDLKKITTEKLLGLKKKDISSFRITIIDKKNDQMREYKNKGIALEQYTLNFLKSANAGDIILVDEIKSSHGISTTAFIDKAYKVI
ncbi:MAG: energy transducer TonB, partial [Chitinophagaceae bacterium]|nr:energy transducer TonB [Chitinophagaceae bacterium]